MPYYEWRGDGEFHDNKNNRVLERGDVVELSERVASNHDFVEVEPPDKDPECADENCSRTVDEEVEYCWQHESDEE